MISMMSEKYRKKSLYVTRENAVKLKKDEYFIADLIGMKVSTDEGEELGNAVGCDADRRERCLCDLHDRRRGSARSGDQGLHP